MIFIKCEKCGKNLIQRLPNGLFHFKFGKNEDGKTPVDIKIHGNIQMRCLRGSCGHTQTINFFDLKKEI